MTHGLCGGCGLGYHVKADGTMRKHPKGAAVPCSGSDRPPAPDPERVEKARQAVIAGAQGAYNAGVALGEAMKARAAQQAAEPAAPAEPPAPPAPGVYRSTEPMLAPGAPVPPGYAVLSVIAYFPFDASVRSPEEEAALLYEDPGYLSKVLDAVPNSLARIQMKVEG